jgi:sensor histidine kinase YesM
MFYFQNPDLIQQQQQRLGIVSLQTFILIDTLTTIVFSIIISELGILLYRKFDITYPWEKDARKRATIQFSSVTIVTAGFIVSLLLAYRFTLGIESTWFEAYAALGTGIIISLLMNGTYTAVFIFERWKQSLIESERLMHESLKMQLEALRKQVDPHFLFNSLNVLASMIEEQPREATEFVLKLAKVYRYILQMSERDLVRLEEELTALEAYMYLLQARFENALTIQYNINKSTNSCLLPPMTLQLLVENAVKHNIASKDFPLSIIIITEQQEGKWFISVNNTLHRKQQLPASHKVGLQNIMQRYALLGKQHEQDGTVIQSETAEKFIVRLPLFSLQS